MAAEINEKESKINGTDAKILFYNTSFIKVVTASDSARGNRATLLLLDEFRLISKDVIDTILRKFLTQRRMPNYNALSREEKKAEYAKEKNKIMYLSSAYFSDHWSYNKCIDTFKAMMDDKKKQLVCGLPYQLSIAEGLLDPDLVEDEMAESDFSEIKMSMEFEALWWGAGIDSFFEYNSISKNRKIKYPMYPNHLAGKLGGNVNVKIPVKKAGEIRILSADIALMSSKKRNNDASAIFINQMMPTKAGRYVSNIVYADTYEGMRTDDQALIIRRMFDEYQCDYLVLDTNGVGLGLYDLLTKDILDPDTGEVYPAISCCNDPVMADRCSNRSADKVIWSIKANAALNSECAFLLREGFKSGKIRLLANEYDGEDILSGIKGYNSLNPPEKTKLLMPYIHTTLLIDEMVKLQHEEVNGKVRLYERSGNRKDRYSSLSYSFYVANQLEQKMSKKRSKTVTSEQFIFRAPAANRKSSRGGGWR